MLTALAMIPTPAHAQDRVEETDSATRGRPLGQAAREHMRNAWHGAQDVALFALSMIGVDYRFGGSDRDTGLDCSGLIQYVFQQVTGVVLPRTTREMSRLGSKVTVNDLQPGDLVFFNTLRAPFSHVGLYLGGNRFIHAPGRGSEVEVVTLSDGYWRRRFTGARRLVGVLPQLVPGIIQTVHAQVPETTQPQQRAIDPDPGAREAR